MESLFKGYYQPTPEQFKELWEEGTFVFDTNVLLNLYRYKVESRDEVLNVIRQIENRIWIPYQVGLEFHRNRLNVLGEQNSSLSTIKNSIRDSINSIEKKCKDLDLDKRHSEIETSNFIERFRELSESVINELDEIKAKKLTNDVDEDVVLTELSELFSIDKGSLGVPPKDQKILEEIYKDGEFRAKNKIPPSFEDIIEAQKNKSGEEYYAFEGLNYKHGYGDLIVWNQIIDFAKENKKKSVVFITDDKKEDWMRIINSHGKKTISARPELVSEIFKESGVENFYIYDTKSFLENSRAYLETSIQDDTLDDIKFNLRNTDSFGHQSFKDILKLGMSAIDALKIDALNIIEQWLDERYMFTISENDNEFFDFTVVLPDGAVVPVIVKFVNLINNKFLVSLLNSVEISNNYEKTHIILIVSSANSSDATIIHNNVSERFKNKNDLLRLEKTKVIVTVGEIIYEDSALKTLIEYEF